MSGHNRREETLFNAALQLATAEERAAYLAASCGADLQLRQRMEVLLQAHEQLDAPLDKPAADLPARTVACYPPTVLPKEKAGAKIGRYKLLQQIGEGGCGVVYMAEQEEPVRRRVALKIIKLGMDTNQVIARFEAERQALALMDHPNIAKVFDGGATEAGRPYFVMELVRGVKITDYCDEQRLSTRERLDLFTQVCQAVQQLLPLVYEELRRLAASKMAGESPNHTLQATALVHEAWLRLTSEDNRKWNGRTHFFAAAAEAMRRILVDNARRKRAEKRGGGQQRIELRDDIGVSTHSDDDQLLKVNDALDKFAALDPQKSELVKLRYFVGVTIAEAAEILGISESTAKRDWAYARAWLQAELLEQQEEK